MPEVVQTYDVLAKGVGRRDFSKMVEYSTEVTPFQVLGQFEYSSRGIYTIPTVPYPTIYAATLGLPMESPAHWYSWTEASSITVSFFRFYATTNFNALMWIGLLEYTGAGAFVDYLVGKSGYGEITINLTGGITTREGYGYRAGFAVYSNNPTFYISMGVVGVMSNLTRDWIYA